MKCKLHLYIHCSQNILAFSRKTIITSHKTIPIFEEFEEKLRKLSKINELKLMFTPIINIFPHRFQRSSVFSYNFLQKKAKSRRRVNRYLLSLRRTLLASPGMMLRTLGMNGPWGNLSNILLLITIDCNINL